MAENETLTPDTIAAPLRQQLAEVTGQCQAAFVEIAAELKLHRHRRPPFIIVKPSRPTPMEPKAVEEGGGRA